jgi:glyoxylase-like metal-dependent hydrolase (beta-lactamase superfamily II)
MRKQISPQVMAALWNKQFPGLIPTNIVLPEELMGDTLCLEGQELVVVDVGHTDTDDSTCLYVPSVGLVVAGDLAYNDVHQYFAESLTRQKRMEWIAALDKVEALRPKVVISGHKRETNSDGPNVIEETRSDLCGFEFDMEGDAAPRTFQAAAPKRAIRSRVHASEVAAVLRLYA